MKHLTHTWKIVATVVAMLAAWNMAQAELAIGTSMPMTDYTMTNTEDKTITLADVKGEKGTVVVFWCNHCPWVVKWRDRLNEIAKDYDDKGFGFIAVNSNDPGQVAGDSLEAMKEFADKYGYEYQYVVDEGATLAKAYGATKTPHVYVFDADNKLVYVGAIDDNAQAPEKVKQPYLKSTLEALIAGTDISTTNTKALGCGIKFPKN